MAGRRIVDLIALFNASSTVARKHFAIRSSQWGAYASVLRTRRPVTRVTPVQERANNSSHGTTPPDVAKNLQAASEPPPIPSVVAQPPNTSPETHEDVRGQQNIPAESLTEGLNEDSFYLRHGRVGTVVSNLPRKKIPRDATGEDGIMEPEFYKEGFRNVKVVEPENTENLEEPTKGIETQVFHSRRARGLFGFGGRPRPKTEAMPELSKAESQQIAGKDTRAESVVDAATGGSIPKSQAVENSEPELSKLETEEISGRSVKLTLETTEPGADDMPTMVAVSVAQSPDIQKVVFEEASRVLDKPVSKEEVQELADDIAADIQSTTVTKPPKQAYEMTASRVPSSRIGRLFHYGGLAAGMAWGAASESVRRAAGGGGNAATGVMFSEANVERLVKKLSRMRGAALKLGQMMSFQDSKMLPGPIHEVLTRVQDSADYMPVSQRDSVLVQNLGRDWRTLFSSFTETPMAAASIGQVHAAILASTGVPVAVKIQYPGVAASISSDLNNLAVLLTASRLLPKGLYLEKTIANARTELGWECDYIREAECAKRFAKVLEPERDVFRIPAIIDEASGPQVLTMERMSGVAVTKAIPNLSQAERDFIGTQLLGLCFREVAKYRFMQTDPNWTNFLWNAQDRKIELLDFGASREYPEEFIKLYTSVLRAAADGDRSLIKDLSIKLGYLTGMESPAMTDAHVASILTLAEPFSKKAPEIYDFRDQTVTERVKAQIPLMIRERLAPPPEETYSLHRKLSGAFLLCARLGSKVPCRKIFNEALG